MNSFRKPAGDFRPEFLTVNTYLRYQNIVAKAHMEVGIGGDPNDPRLEDINLPNVTWSLVPIPDEPVAQATTPLP
jgi:hypothetical protein